MRVAPLTPSSPRENGRGRRKKVEQRLTLSQQGAERRDLSLGSKSDAASPSRPVGTLAGVNQEAAPHFRSDTRSKLNGSFPDDIVQRTTDETFQPL